jgi:hypothetical protein
MKYYAIKMGREYWSNRLGFGSMKSATVFTQAERDYYTLPYPQDKCKWVELNEQKHHRIIERSLKEDI